ncbi:AMP-binding protein [Agromyces ramosus]|uniref:Acyl-CoA synthetase (AMP-forming)/AMP-acid ligase II n=1 Tax=Agromyces ramosus TaxID=33879 RepID=A0ABU0RC60_9MICO|nr:AMP-binding protein [Agromyces ramosus]MDQ0895342.1 acyl-CoA synthetase (AMP-forming)/AMP-acid ligase II [Agromyces ramosus]
MRETATFPTPGGTLDLLGGDPATPALVTADGIVDYAELRERVRSRAAQLGPERRLVMIHAANAIEPLVTYLAALEGGHVVLLVSGDDDAAATRHRDQFLERHDPDVVFRAGDHGWLLDERRDGTRHELHPDLAMLASTSGSTGSPKLVRLSHANLLSNAASIADYLRIGPDDRAATTLPMHYCYGLSVVNSHLLSGGSLLLTERSVIEPAFWADFRDAGATSFAGVPYTFDLLDGTDFAARTPPTLRYVTQAGGRLGADRVERYARLGRERGFDVVVMYGQTEATARMAYLPPDLAETHPGSIGIPIPGGAFRIDGDPVGELVYEGPNVMLGYAEGPEDFADGATIDELRTGDLARLTDSGLYEIVGRVSRFVKVFGLRIDLDRIEGFLLEGGIEGRAISHDERLTVFVLHDRDVAATAQLIADRTGLPAHVVRVHPIAEFPRTSSGKPDQAALARHVELLERREAERQAVSAATDGATDGAAPMHDRIRDLYAELLGRPDTTLDDSFVALDGDSLSYVEVSLQLGRLLGTLPADWPGRSIRELAGEQQSRPPAAATLRRRWVPRVRQVETSVVLRTLAIVLIVATHADLIALKGGAHLLLAVAGFNLARFRLADVPRRARLGGLLRSVTQLLVPAVLWIGGVALIAGTYDPATVLLMNNVVSDDTGWTEQWHFWFLEAIVWSIVGVAVLLLVPVFDRLERRRGFAVALALVAATLTLRYVVAGGIVASSPTRYAIPGVLWLIAIGWLIARATTTTQRLLATAIVLATVPGFFDDPAREALIVVGLVLLTWVRSLPVPAVLAGLVGAIASASMFVYLTHWQVYPPIEEVSPALAVVASFAVGLLVWRGYGTLSRSLTRSISARRPR